ncbi:hypothetical protein AMJ87_05825 [candidate division WOR_3 bacterium SM23_60]|uniref:Uncharacterized protein n=1 Tax=candidate division WOR_3 bacterium SM23_60 TaxID=1703780 RepID=A0A0S8GG74_UNCW3|nr:MAG: hypothetical protein AMJ87_05825 [candidate division WOR_3 bacterium SM23_60]
MKGIVSLVLCSLVGAAWASHTRMDILMARDYLDDITNINVYPHHIVLYQNMLYGDITARLENYGVVITPDTKYGAFAVWQEPEVDQNFNIGYGIQLKRFDLGIHASPVKDHRRIGVGFGRTFFKRRFDVSFSYGEDEDIEHSEFNVRLRNRRGDFVIIPRYRGNYILEPLEYYRHRFGVLVQRLVFNDGFVFLGAEYDFTRGDIENEFTNIYAGLEMPLSRRIVFLLGFYERITEDFDALAWHLEPGFRIRIKEFAFDFHLDTDTLFEDDEFTLSIFKSFGIELNFGKF